LIAEKALSTDVVDTGNIKANSISLHTNGKTKYFSLPTIFIAKLSRSPQVEKAEWILTL
jgi:hypothetical protein